jgi:SAM-dependent methyltransferase
MDAGLRLMFKRHTILQSDRIRVTEHILRKLAPRRVLELGAGDCSFQSAIRRKAEWITADFDKPCDAVCDFNTEHPKLPFADSSFDLAICTEVIEHLLWPQGLLAEIRRVLSPAGHLLVSVPNCVSATYRVAWVLGKIPSCAACGNLPAQIGPTVYERDSGTIAGHVVDFSKPRLAALLDYAGFEPVAMQGSGLIRKRQIVPHWIVPVSWASNIICLARKSSD